MNQLRNAACLALALSVVVPSWALAQRGGRGGGGMGRMGGGFAPRTPSYRPSMPSYRPPSAPSYRPSVPNYRMGMPSFAPGNAGRVNQPLYRNAMPINRPPVSQIRPNTSYIRPVNRFPGVPNTAVAQHLPYTGRPGYWGGFANAYHGHWYRGYWGGYYPGFGWGLGTGLLLGSLATWGMGSSLYSWGYMPYMNPYYSVGYAQPIYVQQPVATSAATITPTNFDYSRPLNLDSTPPDQATVDAAIAKFDSARDAFKSGDYALALQLTDEALTSLPNDVAIQEFRGLVLFALRDYERAAATIYSVLSVGPGWDWATMIDLYPDLDTYTQQLRTLEAYRDAHLDQPGPRFVLGYQYLCEGYPDAAIAEFKEVVKLKPNDKLTADLLKKLSSQSASNPAETPPAAPAEETPPPTPTPTAGNTTPAGAKPTEFAGNWTATPASGVSINLTMDSDGNFTWTVNQQGGPVKISGQATLSDGVMTLNSTSNGPMVGRVTKNGPNEFKLKAVGTDESDPGLTFKKAN